MKNVVKISILTATMTVAMMFFGGCSKDNGGSSLVSGSFDGVVTAKVDGTSGLYVNVAAAVNDAGFDRDGYFVGNFIGEEVNFKNGSFSIELPTSGLSSYLTDVTDFFEELMKADDRGKIKVSDPSARIMDVDIIGFYIDDDDEVYVSGLFSYTTSDKKTTCLFVYVDSDVNITGGANISVSLKKGWNRVYVSDKLTTKAPDGLKWSFKYFE